MTTHPNAPSQNAQPPARTNNNGRELPTAPPAGKFRAYLAEQYGYTPEQVDVVRNMIAVGATDAELEFFLATSKRLGLDPFARQVWFVKRPKRIEDDRGDATYVNVGEPQTSIDGYRTVAERSGEYEGQGSAAWCGADGKWLDVWTKSEPPVAARALIFRRGHREPLSSVALFAEFCPKYRNGKSPQMWIKMPSAQLLKCAESAGLRRAFPRDLSGTSTDVEMEHVYADAAGSYSAPSSTPALPAAQVSAKQSGVSEKLSPSEAPADVAAAPDVATGPTEMTDLEREIAVHLETIGAATSRDGLQAVGGLITEAKRGDPKNERVRAILDVLEPALQKQWRALGATRGAKR